jgi:hypothetical protein
MTFASQADFSIDTPRTHLPVDVRFAPKSALACSEILRTEKRRYEALPGVGMATPAHILVRAISRRIVSSRHPAATLP